MAVKKDKDTDMADSITLDASKRETLGKQVKNLRKQGILPGVIHDHGKESVHVQMEHQAFMKAFHEAGRHHPVELKLDGKKYTTLIRTTTIEPRYNTVTHVVFNAVKANEKVETSIPVSAKYAEDYDNTPAERTGLIVLTQLDEVQVKALPRDLPDALHYDAEKLVAVGDQVTVADLAVPAGVEIETEAEHVLATVFEPSALAAANDDAGGDAEVGDESSVDSDHESNAVEGTQSDEIRPGGKEQKESKDQAQNPEKS